MINIFDFVIRKRQKKKKKAQFVCPYVDDVFWLSVASLAVADGTSAVTRFKMSTPEKESVDYDSSKGKTAKLMKFAAYFLSFFPWCA